VSANARNGRRWILVFFLVLGLGALLALRAGVESRQLAGDDGRSNALHRELQEARLTAELSCGRPTVFASEPPDPASLAALDWSGLLSATVTGSPEERWRAIAILGELRDARAVPALLTALTDRRGTVRPCLAAQSLGALRDPRAVDALIEATRVRDNDDLRLCAIKALGLLRNPRAVPALVDAVERRDMSVAAAYALARIGDADGARAVARAAHDEALAPWLVGPLGEFGLAEAEPALRTLADSDATDPATRASATRGLWKLAVLRARDREDALTRALADSSVPARRAWAAWRLGDEGFASAAAALVAALGDDDRAVQMAAAAALLRLEGAGEGALLERAGSEDPSGRLAVAALGFVGSERTLPALRALAEPDEPDAGLARASLRWLHLRGVR